MSENLHCHELPDSLPPHSTLYLTAPQAALRAQLRTVIEQAGLSIQEPHSHVLAVQTSADSLYGIGMALAEALAPQQRAAARCYLSTDEMATPADFMQAQTADCLIDWIKGQWLKDVLDGGHLMTHFQPIVSSLDPQNVFAYECLLRGHEPDGATISPDRLYNAARAIGHLPSLDQAARLTAIESASKWQISSNVFINFNPRSIDDPARCLESSMRAALSSTIPTEQFVFEVVESDEINDFEQLVRILDHLRDAGCRVALDDIGAGYNSLSLMARIKPDFIKLDMGLIRNVDLDKYKSRVTSKLIEMAKELDVRTVAEGIESIGEWQWACEHGADLVQGYLIARPEEEPPKPHFTPPDGTQSSLASAEIEHSC